MAFAAQAGNDNYRILSNIGAAKKIITDRKGASNWNRKIRMQVKGHLN